MVRYFSGLVAALAALCFGAGALAQFSADEDAPIDITGAQFEVFQNEDFAIWTGDVQVVQGEVVLTAPKIRIHGLAGGEFSKVEASGGIRYTNGVEAISGDSAVYEKASDTITVTGNVVVVQGKQVMTGEKMTYHLGTGKVVFAAAGRTRVRGVFFTEDQNGPSS